MNPFDFAKKFGYTTKDILSYLSRQMPGLGPKINQSRTLGYTDSGILNYLGNQFKGAEVSPDMQRRYPDSLLAIGPRGYEGPDKATMGGAAPVIGGLAGAAIGGLVGGPAGAVQGAAAGAAGLTDILQSYDKHVSTGGSLGLGDFLKAAAKAVGSAALARSLSGLAASVAPDIAEGEIIDITGSARPEGSPPGGLIGGPGQPPPSGGPVAPTGGGAPPIPQGSGGQGMSGGQAINALAGLGVLGAVQTLANQLQPSEIAGALANMGGGGKLKGVEAQLGEPLDLIIAKAIQEIGNIEAQSQQQPEQQSDSVPVPTPQQSEQLPAAAEQPGAILSEPTTLPLVENESPEATIDKSGLTLIPEKQYNDITPYIFTAEEVQEDPGKFEIDSILSQVLPIPESKKIKGKARQIKPLSSTKVLSSYYRAGAEGENGTMQSLFSDGSIYEYENVPQENWNNFKNAIGVAKTTGHGALRVHHSNRGDSLGRAHKDWIEDEKHGIPGKRISDDKAMNRNMLAVKRADKVMKSLNTFDNFAHIIETAMANNEINAPHVLEALEEAGAELSQQELRDLIYDINIEIRRYGNYRQKNPDKLETKPAFNWTEKRAKSALTEALGGKKNKKPATEKAPKARPKRVKGPT